MDFVRKPESRVVNFLWPKVARLKELKMALKPRARRALILNEWQNDWGLDLNSHQIVPLRKGLETTKFAIGLGYSAPHETPCRVEDNNGHPNVGTQYVYYITGGSRIGVYGESSFDPIIHSDGNHVGQILKTVPIHDT